jgi:hypothetical protein
MNSSSTESAGDGVTQVQLSRIDASMSWQVGVSESSKVGVSESSKVGVSESSKVGMESARTRAQRVDHHSTLGVSGELDPAAPRA